MSLRIERIWVRRIDGEETLSWTAENVQKVASMNRWPEDNNSNSFVRAAFFQQEVIIEDFRWTGCGTRDLEPLRYILSLCNEADNLEVWVLWDDGTPMECVWPVLFSEE